ncbi:MAG TPA: rRNA maturation RNase YbeY [Burkholderiales bacterium]|nr:rRNA maturation RNase YbeY [Burkholderiales bacterium]
MSTQFAVAARGRPSRRRLRAWAQAALERDVELTVRVVGRAEGRRLNRDFRGRDRATNVLTFVYSEPGQPLAGDIVLCAPVVEAEARAQGKARDAHYAHLVVHGMLHLQGYDHERSAAAAAMEARESEIVTRLGYADPYADDGPSA